MNTPCHRNSLEVIIDSILKKYHYYKERQIFDLETLVFLLDIIFANLSLLIKDYTNELDIEYFKEILKQISEILNRIDSILYDTSIISKNKQTIIDFIIKTCFYFSFLRRSIIVKVRDNINFSTKLEDIINTCVQDVADIINNIHDSINDDFNMRSIIIMVRKEYDYSLFDEDKSKLINIDKKMFELDKNDSTKLEFLNNYSQFPDDYNKNSATKISSEDHYLTFTFNNNKSITEEASFAQATPFIVSGFAQKVCSKNLQDSYSIEKEKDYSINESKNYKSMVKENLTFQNESTFLNESRSNFNLINDSTISNSNAKNFSLINSTLFDNHSFTHQIKENPNSLENSFRNKKVDINMSLQNSLQNLMNKTGGKQNEKKSKIVNNKMNEPRVSSIMSTQYNRSIPEIKSDLNIFSSEDNNNFKIEKEAIKENSFLATSDNSKQINNFGLQNFNLTDDLILDYKLLIATINIKKVNESIDNLIGNLNLNKIMNQSESIAIDCIKEIISKESNYELLVNAIGSHFQHICLENKTAINVCITLNSNNRDNNQFKNIRGLKKIINSLSNHGFTSDISTLLNIQDLFEKGCRLNYRDTKLHLTVMQETYLFSSNFLKELYFNSGNSFIILKAHYLLQKFLDELDVGNYTISLILIDYFISKTDKKCMKFQSLVYPKNEIVKIKFEVKDFYFFEINKNKLSGYVELNDYFLRIIIFTIELLEYISFGKFSANFKMKEYLWDDKYIFNFNRIKQIGLKNLKPGDLRRKFENMNK